MTTSESFRKEVAEKLDVVVKSLDARASVAFSSCLSAEERKYVHHLAEQFGLRHESKGRGDARFISVSKDPGKAARRNLGARNRTAEEIPKLAWPEAALEALEDPLVKHAAEGNNAQVAASSAPLQAVSPRTIDRLLQSKLPESRLKSAEPLEPPGPPATELLSVRQALPAWQCREQLLEAVQSKQVTLVIGETGCGKSTQVPQFILEACPGANILVTQPRRISALSLAHRVAQERGETVGHVVGYSVHLEHQSSPRTRLHFCTAGVARRRILETPDLPEVTHVVMDKLHERDKVTDFLLIAIRDLLARRPELRIILMSATMQHETFQKYVEGCAEVQIHGRVHPVDAIYLEDLAPKLHKLGYVEHLGPGFAAGGYGYGSWDNKGNEKSFKYQVLVGQTHHPDHLCGYGANAWESLEGRRKDEGLFLHDVLQQTKGVLYDLPIIEALLDVLQQEPKEVNGRTNGGILIFLPGWDDIDRLLKRLTKVLPSGQFRILPLHSQIRLEQQKEVFQVPPQGVRKIVLSTNIAETAITIDDIDTVIDCGRAKETSYDAFLRVPTLNTSWISKASASQRRGRAGRTKPRTLKIGSELLGYLCCFGLYIGFMPIVGFVTNLGMAVNMGPFQPIWEGFAPTLGLTIFLCFLPTLFMTIFRTFFVLKSESLAQHKLQFWFFVFQLIFVVLVTTVGKSIITQFRHIAENPNDIIQIMADSLPKATHFYMTYLVLQWSRRAMEMLRYMPLSKFLVFRAIFSQEEAKEMAEPEDQDSFGFGARNVNLAVSVVLGLLFCSMSPLVTLFAMFDLLLARMTYGYLVIYAETRKPDLGGVFWVTQIQFVQLAMALYCMFMVGVLRQKSSSCAWLVAVPSLLSLGFTELLQLSTRVTSCSRT